MPVCTKCKEDKGAESFNGRNNRAYPFQSWCRACSVAGGVALMRKRKQDWIDYKGGMCAKCGAVSLHPAAYQFHHRDSSTKEFTMRRAANFGWERAKAELDKCDLLCANCHFIHHANY